MLESRETGLEINDITSSSEIPKWNKNVTVIEKIGEGSFGEVLKVKDLETGKFYAKKGLKLPIDAAEKELVLANLDNEAGILYKLNQLHVPGIPRFEGVHKGQNNLDMFMEFVDGSNLDELERQGKSFDYEEIDKIILNIGQALATLHGLETKGKFSKTILHLDVKPSNIVSTDDPNRPYVLMDYGSSASTYYNSNIERKAFSNKEEYDQAKEYLHHTRKINILGTVPFADPIYTVNRRDVPCVDVYEFAATILDLSLKERIPREASDKWPQIDISEYVNKTNLPDKLQVLLKRSLSWKMEDRPRDMREFMDEYTKKENHNFTLTGTGEIQISLDFLKLFPNNISNSISNTINDYNLEKIDKDKLFAILNDEVFFELQKNIGNTNLYDSRLIRLFNYFCSDLKSFLESRQKDSSVQTEKEKKLVNMEIAKKIMGKDFLGPEQVEDVFAIEAVVPSIPFSREELERAKELGQMLILRQPITIEKMIDNLSNKFKDDRGLLHGYHWAREDLGKEFWNEDEPEARWALVSKEIIPGSAEKDYLEQTDKLIEYLQNKVFKNKSMPTVYHDAIDEYLKSKPNIVKIRKLDREKAEKILERLNLTKLCRQSPVEAFYDSLVYFQTTGESLMTNALTWTNRRDFSDGFFVAVGGMRNINVIPQVTSFPFYVGNLDHLGVCFSRII